MTLRAPSPPLRWALALWSLQIVFAAMLPLFADEAYYLAWSRQLDVGYFDHPPFIAWWVAAGGGAVRVTGLVLWPGVCWLLYDAGRRWGVAESQWIPALVMATPLGFVAPILTTPDGPLLVAWSLALWGVAAQRNTAVILGLALGLWSKAAVLAVWPGIVIVLGWRRTLWITAGAVALYSPHILWSAQHDWLPWSFQSQRISAAPNALEFIGGQGLLLGPWVLWAVARVWRRADGPLERRLRALSLPILAAWTALACLTRVEGNWPALAWPAAMILIAARYGPNLERMIRRSAAFTVIMATCATVFLHLAPPGVGPPRDGPRLAGCLAKYTNGPWIGRRYQETALLNAAGVPAGYLPGVHHRPSQFDLWKMEPTPLCGYTYLGDAATLGDRCRSPVDGGSPCGVRMTECGCGTGTKRRARRESDGL